MTAGVFFFFPFFFPCLLGVPLTSMMRETLMGKGEWCRLEDTIVLWSWSVSMWLEFRISCMGGRSQTLRISVAHRFHSHFQDWIWGWKLKMLVSKVDNHGRIKSQFNASFGRHVQNQVTQNAFKMSKSHAHHTLLLVKTLSLFHLCSDVQTLL